MGVIVTPLGNICRKKYLGRTKVKKTTTAPQTNIEHVLYFNPHLTKPVSVTQFTKEVGWWNLKTNDPSHNDLIGTKI